MNENETGKYKVPAENIESLQNKIAEINKKIARLIKRGHQNLESVKISVGPAIIEKVEGKPDRVYHEVELVSSGYVKVDGWEFVAALTHVEDVGTVLRAVPGAKLADKELAKYRDATPENCDHCRSNRKRTETFIVRNPEGTLKQVGRQCLRAYTGLGNPELLCAQAELLFSVAESLEEAERGCTGSQMISSISCYVPFVCCSIRENGWMSKGKARELADRGQTVISTSENALANGLWAYRQEFQTVNPKEQDYQLAKEVIDFVDDYFSDKDVASLSDYENNLRVAMASGVLYSKLAGIVASAVVFYQKHQEKKAQASRWANLAISSKFQGQVGKREIFRGLKVMSAKTFEGGWGTTYFYNFVSVEGHCFVVFSSKDLNLQAGEEINLKATVKAHEVYTPKSGSPYHQTILTRASKVIEAVVVSVDEKSEAREFNEYHMVKDGLKFIVLSKTKKRGLKVGSKVEIEPSGNYPDRCGETTSSLVSAK